VHAGIRAAAKQCNVKCSSGECCPVKAEHTSGGLYAVVPGKWRWVPCGLVVPKSGMTASRSSGAPASSMLAG
jgi:hypothetical protein